MKAQAQSFVDEFTPARRAFEDLLAWADTTDETDRTHSFVEETLWTRGLEVLRLLYQGLLDRCAVADRRRAVAQAAHVGADVVTETRPLESLFGRVTVTRNAIPTEAGAPRDFQLDRALNLPAEVYSLPVRQRVAESARSVAMGATVEAIDRTTGAHVPKRQVEQLVVRAAQDFDEFYAQRPQPANDTLSDQALLAMTSDGKGITMVPHGLRPATRKKAAAAQAARPAHKDPMALKGPRTHNRRMAICTAVYQIEPHVRTAEQVVLGLSHKTDDACTSKVPRPQNKTVTASVVKSQKEGITGMFDEGERRDPTHAKTPVVLVDGEPHQLEKIKREAKSRAWPIILIIDLIHVLHYVWSAAKALCKKTKTSPESVVASYLMMLLRGQSDALARTLETLATERGLSCTARKPVDKCVAYLRKYAKYLRYDRYLAAGYPIATGVIEGVCRYLVEDRMGITGACWDLPSAEAVLRLRALWTNGDWNEYWAFHERQMAAKNAGKLAA